MKNTKNIYIKQDPWGGYAVTNNGQKVAASLNFTEAEAMAKAIIPAKPIVVRADWGTMTLRA